MEDQLGQGEVFQKKVEAINHNIFCAEKYKETAYAFVSYLALQIKSQNDLGLKTTERQNATNGHQQGYTHTQFHVYA